MRFAPTLLLLLAVAGLPAASAAPAADASLDAVLQRAAAAKMPVLLDFYTDW